MRTEAVPLAPLLCLGVQLGALVGCGGAPPASPPRRAAAPIARTNAPAVAPPMSSPRPLARPAPSPLAPSPLRRVPDGLPRDTPQGSEPIVFGRDAPVPTGLPAWLRAGELRYDKKSDYWSPCVREFVQTQPEPVRLELGEALSLYSTSCTTGPARRIEFRTPAAGRSPPQSYLGLVGALDRASCDVSLTAAYHGEPVHAERITLISDDERWSSPRIAFDRDGGWEIATLPLTHSLLRVVQQAIGARDTVVRFEGAHGYQDVVVSEQMKQDLRVMLDALDAINRL